jgi:hypothetical protein
MLSWVDCMPTVSGGGVDASGAVVSSRDLAGLS